MRRTPAYASRPGDAASISWPVATRWTLSPREQKLSRSRAVARKQRDDFVGEARRTRVRFQVRVFDRRERESGVACKRDELLVRVEMPAARHWFGRCGRSLRLGRHREHGKAAGRPQYAVTLRDDALRVGEEEERLHRRDCGEARLLERKLVHVAFHELKLPVR